MKLSVCIPIYNFDVNDLVNQLTYEIHRESLEAEILLIDDASSADFRSINSDLSLKVSNFIQLDENIGRSKIRNLFLKYSSSEYLLFLDCDAKIENEFFLKTYLEAIDKNPEKDVFYGGFTVNKHYEHTLRNKYSIYREISKTYDVNGFSTLQTINFVIKKNCLEHFPFVESLNEYGYEDFIFTQKLEEANKSLIVINNPVIHNDFSTNEEFLTKAKIGVNSLFKLSQNQEMLVYLNKMKIYRYAAFLKQKKLDGLFLFFYNAFSLVIKSNLKSKNPKIHFFDAFKLGEYVKLMRKFKRN